MSSAFAICPLSVADSTRQERASGSQKGTAHGFQQQPRQYLHHHFGQTTGPPAPNYPSPYSPPALVSNIMPSDSTNTPESAYTLSTHYQSSEYSEVDVPGIDPFLGIDLGPDANTPPFLDDPFFQSSGGDANEQPKFGALAGDTANFVPTTFQTNLPISPHRTPFLNRSSSKPYQDEEETAVGDFALVKPSAAYRNVARVPGQAPTLAGPHDPPSQLTPDTSGSRRSSNEGLALSSSAKMLQGQSPRVTVSLWGRDNVDVPYGLETTRELHPSHSIDDLGVHFSDGSGSRPMAMRNDMGVRVYSAPTGRRGLDPDNRPSGEGPSINELEAKRKFEEVNQEVDKWLNGTRSISSTPRTRSDSQRSHEVQMPHFQINENDTGFSFGEIPFRQKTENKFILGQTYYLESGSAITSLDLEIMRQNRNWADAPVLFPISDAYSKRYQPDTSQAAIEKFERMCKDNESVVSRAATWGTRRRSLPSLLDIDLEGVMSGNFLKKLAINRREPGARRPSILKELRGLVRRPSATFKRSRNEEAETATASQMAMEPRNSLAPSRSPSRNKSKAVPSINTTLVNIGSNIASIGATHHARNGSIGTVLATSPKSLSGFGGLSVRKPNLLLRGRSKSELPKTSNLADMWKRAGGPPVAALGPSSTAPNAEDKDDDNDEFFEGTDTKAESDELIDGISPDFAGFQQIVLKLNPFLANTNKYLVDRIAYQQVLRYKSLLMAKVKHLECATHGNCPCGSTCIAQGGTANGLDSKGGPRGPKPPTARYDPSEGDVASFEGAISAESFPRDIPVPPTSTLPAEFECQLCFQNKKFQKPSDWTKHVHEDVQPFTCTWERCRDTRMFKRKADWVRHENEGHRHLEWWTCSVDDCRHICYRRDNFLQHLVREHKYLEPKIKTKAAIKRAGGQDQTWAMLEKCHMETQVRPQEEPCRFCGKIFPTWKKLTLHLAKHMEQISLPILRLVSRKELAADTIVSPVQDSPPSPFAATFPPNPNARTEANKFDVSSTSRAVLGHQTGAMAPAYPLNSQHASAQGYSPAIPGNNFSQSMYQTFFDTLSPHMGASQLGHGHQSNRSLTTPIYMGAYAPQYLSMATDTEPFPALTIDALGFQDSAPHMQYNSMLDPAGAEKFTSQESAPSLFQHSPHQGPADFYTH